jgi:uncharacterized membrane protein
VVDHHWRSVVKAVSYRITGTITTFVISWLVTRKFALALSIGFADVFVKILVYYLHERAWNNIKFGRKPIDYQI